MKLMKKNLKILFLAVFVAAASCSFTTKEFNDPDKELADNAKNGD